MAEEKRVKNHRATVPSRSGEAQTYDWIEIDGTLIRVDCITAVVPETANLEIHADVAHGPLKFERGTDPHAIVRDVRRALGIVS